MPAGTKYKNVTGKKMNCICPRCGESHTKHLLWAGRGIPKIFCTPCKDFSDEAMGGLDQQYEMRYRRIKGKV